MRRRRAATIVGALAALAVLGPSAAFFAVELSHGRAVDWTAHTWAVVMFPNLVPVVIVAAITVFITLFARRRK